jgi:hypothetical protein
MSDLILPNGKHPKDLTTFERIRLSYDEKYDIRLTPHEEETKELWAEVWTMLTKFKSRKAIIKFLDEQKGRSRAQANRDITNAKNLFGDLLKVSKIGERQLLYELAMETLILAKKEKDIDGMNKAIANMIKIKGLDKEDFDIPDFSMLQQHIYNIVVDPQAIGLPVIEDLDHYMEMFRKKKRTKNIDISDADIVQ